MGVWARSVNGNGYHNDAPMEIGNNRSPIKFQGGRDYLTARPGVGRAGEWDWVSMVANVTTEGTGTLSFFGNAGAAHPTEFFAPVLVYVPTGTMTPNELAEFALHLQTYRSDARAGQVSLLPGEQLKADSIQVGDSPTITSGAGAPNSAAATGSIYLRTDGEPGATLYVFEKGGWKAVK
jgi:hypothetical protein